MADFKRLSDWLSRPKGDRSSSFLVYRNRFNEVKGYEVEALLKKGDNIKVHDLLEDKLKTFKKKTLSPRTPFMMRRPLLQRKYKAILKFLLEKN